MVIVRRIPFEAVKQGFSETSPLVSRRAGARQGTHSIPSANPYFRTESLSFLVSLVDEPGFQDCVVAQQQGRAKRHTVLYDAFMFIEEKNE